MSSEIDDANIISRHNIQYVKQTLSQHYHLQSNRHFHKFIVKNGGMFEKEQVLSAIIKQVLPNYLLPIKYEKDSQLNDTFFLSSNCWSAIISIISNDFLVTIPDLNIKLEIQIYLDYVKEEVINPIDRIKMTFKKRVNVGDNVTVSIDCSNFHSDSGLKDVYFPLWVPQFQRIIIQTIHNVLYVKSINFSHNKISSLTELTKLSCPKLTDLNLSYNEIGWSDLIPILPEKVQNLWLEGNPLCSSTLSDYVSKVKAHFPHLKRLDGFNVYPESNMPFMMKNSFCNNATHQLVDQFLHHYFKWFLVLDKRSDMVHMYHKDASISISCHFHPSENSFMNNSTVLFQTLSRNILKITNYAKASESFKTGTFHITATLASIPHLDLDPTSTTVDVPFYIENKAIQIIVTGMYRDRGGNMFWISTTFLLHSSSETGSKEWKILNQIISIMSPSREQIQESFGKHDVNLLDSSSFEPSKEDILNQFKDLTSMNTSWCKQFLESTRWDLESALQSFVDQYKGDLVPEEAFVTT